MVHYGVDPKIRARLNLIGELRSYGCSNLDDSHIWWLCNICGYPIYLEIPSNFPEPGVVISAWFEKSKIPYGWSNLLYDEKRVNGKVLVKICVDTDPTVWGGTLMANIERRMRELGIGC